MKTMIKCTVSCRNPKDAIQAISTLLAEKLGIQSLFGEHDWDIEFPGTLDDVEKLAIELAKAFEGDYFFINGCCDQSGLVGCYQNFIVDYDKGNLNYLYSDPYIALRAGERYKDYEAFCEDYQDENGDPLFTEEDYKEFCSGVYFVMCYDNRSVWEDSAEVPLSHKFELAIA